jgi:hypothetical protein
MQPNQKPSYKPSILDNIMLLLAVVGLSITTTIITSKLPIDANAASVQANVTIQSQPPNLTNIRCCFKDSDTGTYLTGDCRDAGSGTEYTPSGGKPHDMLCNFTVTDPNGWQDMGDGWVNITWHRDNVLWNSALDNDTLYINSSCTSITGSETGTNINYECLITNIKYWADGGNWSLVVNLSDGNSLGIPNKGHILMGNMTSIWQSPSIWFGSMDLSANGSQGHLGVAYIDSATNNTGNTKINLQVNGGAAYMNCTIGAIPISNIGYDTTQSTSMDLTCGNLTSSAAWANTCPAFALSDCADSCPGLTSLKSTYWGIRIPPAGIGGTCNRPITIIGAQG